jgi:hypothetical protein
MQVLLDLSDFFIGQVFIYLYRFILAYVVFGEDTFYFQ